VTVNDLPERLRRIDSRRQVGPAPSRATAGDGEALSGVAIRYDLPYKKAKRLWLEVFEYAYITRLLNDHDGNISHAARAAGIDRKSIQRLMKRNHMVSSSLGADEG
jgi:DNA-binding NtrC family response regulator